MIPCRCRYEYFCQAPLGLCGTRVVPGREATPRPPRETSDRCFWLTWRRAILVPRPRFVRSCGKTNNTPLPALPQSGSRLAVPSQPKISKTEQGTASPAPRGAGGIHRIEAVVHVSRMTLSSTAIVSHLEGKGVMYKLGIAFVLLALLSGVPAALAVDRGVSRLSGGVPR